MPLLRMTVLADVTSLQDRIRLLLKAFEWAAACNFRERKRRPKQIKQETVVKAEFTAQVKSEPRVKAEPRIRTDERKIDHLRSTNVPEELSALPFHAFCDEPEWAEALFVEYSRPEHNHNFDDSGFSLNDGGALSFLRCPAKSTKSLRNLGQQRVASMSF